MKFFVPVLLRYSAVLVQFLIAAIITNKLSVQDAGMYFLVSGMILTTYFAAGLGLPDGLVRTIPPMVERGQTESMQAMLGNALTLSLVSALALALVFGLVWGMILSPLFGVLAGLWWFSYGVMFIGSQVLVALGDVRLGAFAFYSAINFALLLIVVPLAFLTQTLSLPLIIGGSGVAAFLAAMAIMIAVLRKGTRLRIGTAKDIMGILEVWQPGITIAAARIAQAMMIWSPVWFAGLMAGTEGAALLGLASRLTMTISAVLAVVRFSIRPELARHAAAERWPEIQIIASRIAFWTTALAALAFAADILVGQFLIVNIFGPGYAPVQILLAILLVGTLGESLGGPVDEVLKMDRFANVVFQSQLAWLAVGAVLQLAGGAVLDEYGIACGYALTFFGYYATLIYILWKKRGVLVLPRLPSRPASP